MLQTRSLILGAALFGGGLLFSQLLSGSIVHPALAVEGVWACYVVDKFPNLEKAAAWEGAVDYANALNTLAPTAPSGKMLVATYPVGGFGAGQGGAPVLCVKN